MLVPFTWATLVRSEGFEAVGPDGQREGASHQESRRYLRK